MQNHDQYLVMFRDKRSEKEEGEDEQETSKTEDSVHMN